MTRRQSVMSREESLAARRRLIHRAAVGRLIWSAAIREMRRALGKTQEDFGKLFGVSRRKIVALEKGEGNPELATLSRFGGAFGLTVGYVPVKQPEDSWVLVSTAGSQQAPIQGDLIMITGPGHQDGWGYCCLATGVRFALETPPDEKNTTLRYGKHGDIGFIVKINSFTHTIYHNPTQYFEIIYERLL